MKYFVLLLIVGVSISIAHNYAFGWCDQNDDWHDAPCSAPYQNLSESFESESWEKHMTSDSHINLTPFEIRLSEEDFTTQGPDHNILVLEQGDSAAVTVHVKNNDDVSHRITLKSPTDSDSDVFSSFVFEPKEIVVLPNGTNSTKLHMTIANKTDTHTTFVTFLGQSDSFGMRGLGFYLAVEKEDREIDFEFIDRSLRSGLPGAAFSDLDTEISECDAELTINNGFGIPRYLPEGYEFQGMDGPDDSKRFIYSKTPILTESTGFREFWDGGGLLLLYNVDGPNVNHIESLPFRVAQNEGQQVMINGMMGDAMSKHTRTVAYSDTKYDVPSDVYFFDEAKNRSVFLRAVMPLDDLLKVAASVPVDGLSCDRKENQTATDNQMVIDSTKLKQMGFDPISDKVVMLEGDPFFISQPYRAQSNPDAKTTFHGVSFSLPSDPNPPVPGGIRTTTVVFPDGQSEVLSRGVTIELGISVSKYSQPTVAFSRTTDSTFFFLVSADSEPPLIQFKSGVPIKKIKCKEGLESILKSSDGSPACVKPETKQKLVERGWTKSDGEWTPLTPTMPELGKTGIYELQKGNKTYDIPYHIKGGSDIKEIFLDKKIINVVLKQHDSGSLEITLSRELIDAEISEGVYDSLIVLIDGLEVPYDETSNEASRTLTIQFEKESEMIEIIGVIPT